MSDENAGAEPPDGSPPSKEAGPSPSPASFPTYSQLQESISKTLASRSLQRSFEKKFSAVSVDSERKYEHLKGLREHYRHKGRWSNFLMFVMLLMVVYQSVLLGLVGGGVWDFSKYQWLLPALLVQNLAQVVGLAIFVVKALFKDLD